MSQGRNKNANVLKCIMVRVSDHEKVLGGSRACQCRSLAGSTSCMWFLGVQVDVAAQRWRSRLLSYPKAIF
jgi:hypothetical protein